MVFYTDDAEINHNNRNENGWISSGFVGGEYFLLLFKFTGVWYIFQWGKKQCIISGMSNDYSRGQVSNHNFVIEWLAIGIRVCH